MKKFLLIAGLLFCAGAVHAQTYDAYGGLNSISCTNATGHFITVKISNRWWFCTPAGHAYYFEGIGAWPPPPNPAKYSPTACTVAQDLITEAQGWNFNGVGELSSYDNIKPIGGCSGSITKMPMVETIELSLYATAGPFAHHQNFTGYVTQPTKNIIFGNGPASHLSYRGAGLTDDFFPTYATFANQLTINDPFFASFKASAYSLGIFIDDTDFKAGFGSSAAFDSIPDSHNKPNLGYIVATTSPVQTFGNFTYNQTPVFYSDVAVYSKNLMASPPTNCVDATHPIDGTHGTCSWATWLQKKYTTIGALNTAWGSTYTTFGSSGQCVGYTSTSFCGTGSGSSVETIGTGNGTATVFTHTLTNANVSQNSVQLYFNGNIVTGDCPGCSVSTGASFSNVANQGPFQASTNYAAGDQFLDSNGYVQTVTIAGVSGATAPSWNTAYAGTTVSGAATTRNDGPALVAGQQPWAQDGQITFADDCADGFPQGSYWLQTVWHGAPSTPSRLIGITILTGCPRITILAQNNANDKPAGATGVDIYVACRVASGAAAKGCVSSGSSQPAPTLQASNVAYPSGSWQEPTTGLASGAALPGPVSFVDYTTGNLQITTTAPLQTGVVATVAYISNGYGFGTGILDEDGRHSWMGHESICLQPVANTGAGSTSWTCRTGNPGGNAAPDMTPAVANDVVAWQTQYAMQYFSTIRTAMKQASAEPNLLYFGCDTCGDWFGPPRAEILAGMKPYVDGIFTTILPSDSTGPAKYSYLTQNFGDMPVMLFSTFEANPDSAFAASTSGGVYQNPTQPARGANWYAMQNFLLNTLSFNNTFQGVGIVWWGMYDFGNEGFNWGLKSPTDNAYDAHEAASGSVACSAPLSSLTCGSEPNPGGGATRPFGDLFGGANGVTAANLLWTSGVTPTNTLTVHSTNPATGVTITNAPTDNSSTSSGNTSFVLTFNTGTSVTLTAPSTAGGNAFANWTGCTSTSGLTCTILVNSNVTVTANYTATTNVLTVHSTVPSSGVTITAAPPDNSSQSGGTTPFNLTYNTGTTVTLTAPSSVSGNGFQSWTGCDSASTVTCTIAVSSNKTVTANYVAPPPTFTLTVATLNPASGVLMQVSPTDNNGKTSGNSPFFFVYTSGATVAITPPNLAGTHPFGSWAGCDSVAALACTVAMTGNRTVTAQYVTPVIPTVTLATTNPASGVVVSYSPADTNANTSCTAPCMPQFPQGTAETFTFPVSASGNTLASITGCDSVSANVCSKIVNASVTITANYITPTGPTVPPGKIPLTAKTTLDLSVGISPPDANGNSSGTSFQLTNSAYTMTFLFPPSGTCVTSQSHNKQVWHCTWRIISATQTNCSCQ